MNRADPPSTIVVADVIFYVLLLLILSQVSVQNFVHAQVQVAHEIVKYAQLTHCATIENRVSDLRRHAHFNI